MGSGMFTGTEHVFRFSRFAGRRRAPPCTAHLLGLGFFRERRKEVCNAVWRLGRLSTGQMAGP